VSYFRYLCLLAYSGVQHIALCCIFALFVFVLYTLGCQFFLDCQILIAPSVFSTVYLPQISHFSPLHAAFSHTASIKISNLKWNL